MSGLRNCEQLERIGPARAKQRLRQLQLLHQGQEKCSQPCFLASTAVSLSFRSEPTVQSAEPSRENLRMPSRTSSMLHTPAKKAEKVEIEMQFERVCAPE